MSAGNGKSDPPPRVAVLIPTYNRPELLARAIGSVLKQHFQNWNAYIINDGGEDVAQVVGGFRDARLHYLSTSHRGKAASLNLGIRSSQSEFIAYLDDDDLFYPNHLELLVKALEASPEAVMAYPDTCLVYLQKRGDRWEEARRKLVNTEEVTFEKLLEMNRITQNFLHRRAVLERTGLFDEQLEVLIDWDMLLRLFAAGPAVHVPEVTSEYYRKIDESENVINAITGMFFKDRERYLAHRDRVMGKMVYLPFYAQGKQPPENNQAEEGFQKLAVLVQKRLSEALSIAESKEEVEDLRRACKEQAEVLKRFRSNSIYKVYHAAELVAAHFRR